MSGKVVTAELQPTFDIGTLGLHQPSIHQWYGLWAIEPTFGQAFASRMQGFNLAQHAVNQTVIVAVDGQAKATAELTANTNALRISNGVALIDVSGTVMKYSSSLSDSTSTVALRQQIRAADRNPDVKEILVRIDSPGGTVAGVREVFADMQGASKPVTAFIEDLGASAGYWIAAGASRIWANAGARVGSIGVFMAVADQSKSAEQLGVKVHLLATGEFKGLGVPGTEVTDKQLAYLQELVDQHFADFQAAVMSSRKMSAAALKAVADGRVFPAAQAAASGLIDGVKTFDEVLAELQARAAGGAKMKGKAVSQESQDGPKAASLADLEAACPGASSDFLLKQLKAGATVQTAMGAFMQEQKAALEKAQAELAAKEEELAKAKTAPTGLGNAAVGAGLDGKSKATDSGDPIAAFEAAVKEELATTKDMKAAIQNVARSQPQLHGAYLAAQQKLRA